MSLPFFAPSLRQPIARISISARAGRYFARLRAWFSSDYDPAWAYTLQLEHLLAYATWSEIIADLEGESRDTRPNP
jgi:hypothetical protein